ncbi:hypothetical protein [Nocardia sp. NPDC049707]|uniref:hypothetical protein n=1 Tax=Nocardia sp. NPDC049707 TaxID=3154735 RepID=UPI00344AB716
MSRLIQFSDGQFGLVDDNGFVDEFDAIELPELETTTPALWAMFIDIDATSVVDTQLPERTAFVGPPRPLDLPVELVERVAAAVREWGER